MTKSDLKALTFENPLGGQFGSDVTTGGRRSNDAGIPFSTERQEDPPVFATRFSRCRPLLHFIACRVLAGTEGADRAVENCRLMASRNPPRFEHEGAFRSWLLRVLIDEARAVLRKYRAAIVNADEC